MWYEALPSLILIGGLVMVYQKASMVICNTFTGKPYARDTSNVWVRSMIERDMRVSGSAWVQAGLENIPDDE